MRKVLLFVTIAFFAVSLAFSQTLMLGTQGISPRDAERDTTDIYDAAYNGLLNVGVETQMYLKGKMVGASLTAPAWSVIQAPAGSVADITETADIDTSTQVAVFRPDVVGTYVIEFTDGGESAQVTINAGTFLGIEDGNCALCHRDKVNEWTDTGHSSMLERALNGTLSSYYRASCISCHTTGFDPQADNNGFDDFDFEFPETLTEGVYDSTVADYPEAMKRANIQCESCHGPASAHNGDTSDSKMVSSLSADTCALCHDSGTHHVFPEQWDASAHGNPQFAAYAGGRATCSNCHSGAGFVAYLENGESNPPEVPPVTAITCASCHDPHSDENPHQLRRVAPVTLGDGTVVDQGGNGLLCMTCHKGRRNAADYTGPGFRYSRYYGPHSGPQADMLAGANVPTFGKKLPSSPHLTATKDACVTCHMAEGIVDEEDNVILVGSHSFNVKDPVSGQDNVKVCAQCHGDVGDSFDEKKYYYNGVADHDGDGIEEGLHEEVEGLMEELALMLPPVDTLDVDVSGTYIYTDTEKKAAFNYLFVEDDRSHGIHNPAFAVALLKVSIQAMLNNALEGEIVAIEDVPNDNGKQVLIIWDKLVDDGIAADPIVSYAVKRLDGETWVTVGELTADGSPRYALVVPTVWDSTANGPGLTTFLVRGLTRSGDVHESLPAEGYSVDNLIPTAPTGFIAILSGSEVNISWEESQDVDFNYFALYKGTDAGFEPSLDNQIATTTGTEFFDADIEAGNTYYYKIAAYDFSGNESEFVAAEPVVVSSVASRDKSLPTEFSLAQNYPNPFNPTTVIEFGVPMADDVQIDVYDIRGVHVRTLAQGKFAAGYHTLVWDGRDDRGNLVSAGTYLYRLESPSQSFTKKAIFLK